MAAGARNRGVGVPRVGMPRSEERHRGAYSVGRGVALGLARSVAHLGAVEPLELRQPLDLPIVVGLGLAVARLVVLGLGLGVRVSRLTFDLAVVDEAELLGLGQIEDVAGVGVGVKAAVDEYLVAHSK